MTLVCKDARLVWFPNLLAAGRLFQVRWGPRLKDANSKLVEVVTVADVYDEECANDSLVHICELRFGYKVNLLFRL